MWLQHWRRNRRARIRAIAARLDEISEAQRRAGEEHRRDWETMKGLLLAESAPPCPGLEAIAAGTAGRVIMTEIDGREVIIVADGDGGGDARQMETTVRGILRKWDGGGRAAS